MANYQDFTPPSNATATDIYHQITSLITGAYSIEVIPQGTTNTVVLRVWSSSPYDIANHHQIT